MKNLFITFGLSFLSMTTLVSAVKAQESDRQSATTIEEIVVTAQKREESINEVGMSIQASTGEQLKDLGISDPFDLYKAIAGFSSNVNYAGTSIYTIRGEPCSQRRAEKNWGPPTFTFFRRRHAWPCIA